MSDHFFLARSVQQQPSGIMSMATDPPHHSSKASHGGVVEVAAKDELATSPSSLGLGHHTHNDQRDMQRMGKNQELMVSAGPYR